MKKRKSYFVNFPTSTLFLVLEQNLKELEDLEQKLTVKNSPLLKERIGQVKLVIAVSKSVIVERYLDSNVSLMEITKLLIVSKGIKESVYKEVFTLKVLNSDEIVDLELFNKAISKLDISELMMIIRSKQNSIYGILALKRYDQMIFDVEPDVYQEYVLKKRLDKKKER